MSERLHCAGKELGRVESEGLEVASRTKGPDESIFESAGDMVSVEKCHGELVKLAGWLGTKSAAPR